MNSFIILAKVKELEPMNFLVFGKNLEEAMGLFKKRYADSVVINAQLSNIKEVIEE